MSQGFANLFVSDYGLMRSVPEHYACVCRSAPMRKDGEHYDMRFRISRVAKKVESHLNERAKVRFMAGLPLDGPPPVSKKLRKTRR